MAEISTEMLVKNLVGLRLNDLSIQLGKKIDDVSKCQKLSGSLSKRKYCEIIYYVEYFCQHLEELTSCIEEN